MKRLFALFMVILVSTLLISTNAEARRFGGGSSIGKQRTMSVPAQRSTSVAPAQTTAPPAAGPAQPSGNRWLGPLAGLALGAGLGALFAGSGMGGGIGALALILIVLMAVMSLIALAARRQQPVMQYAGADVVHDCAQMPAPQNATVPQTAAGVPADFPRDSFLRSVKTSFIRLQAANDRKDLDDIREYTTPEMFAEISMQLRESDGGVQKTEVLALEAELLEVATESPYLIASVRLYGQLKENEGSAEAFEEIWHMQKNLERAGSIWLLAGIQQL